MAYVSVFLLALFEAVAVVGLVVPGTTGVAAAGGAAQTGQLSYWGVLGAAVAGAFLGDAASYALGRWLHRWKRIRPWIVRHQVRVDQAERFVRRWGVLGVILGRFLAPTRAFVPLIAGTTEMPLGRFMVANAAGALAWSFVAVTLGEEAVRTYEHVPKQWSVGALGVLAALGLAWLFVKRAVAKRRRAAPIPPTERTTSTWHARPLEEVVTALRTDPRRGLDPEDAAVRLARAGPNLAHVPEPEPWWEELLDSLSEPLQLLLVAVGVVYFLLGDVADGLTILAVIVMVAAVGVASDMRGERAVAALSKMAAPLYRAIRGDAVVSLHARDLVAGDVVLLRRGERVPADIRLVEAVGLAADESALTGESTPAGKHAEGSLGHDTTPAERGTMMFASTRVTAGRGRGIVVETGARTEAGPLAPPPREATPAETPLARTMRKLSRNLLVVALASSVLIPVLGVLVAGRPVREMLLDGLTLAFATVPEALPILIVMVLGVGAYRLARRNAIVKSLRAVETLGCVTVIATDGTGTLTENRPRVTRVITAEGDVDLAGAARSALGRKLLTLAALANDAEHLVRGDVEGGAQGERVGDPVDVAILDAALEAGLDVDAIRRRAHVLGERPFDDAARRMAVLAETEGRRLLIVKGAPESILASASAVEGGTLDRRAWLAEADALAAEGSRALAVAFRELEPDEAGEERDLTLLGFLALSDPVRESARETVRALERAGVEVRLLAGDAPTKAAALAAQIDLDAPVGQPDEKAANALAQDERSAVRALRAKGHVVAVTGDGPDDAAALREADIGVALGTGSDVAREAANLVLADEDLATLEDAVRTGRVLFANLRKAVRYYLAAKLALVLASLVAVLLKLPIPFQPVQIIVMELFMDLGASLTFVSEPAEEDVMERGPRDAKAPLSSRGTALGIASGGLSLAAAVLVPYLFAGGAGIAHAQTAAFTAWMIGHVVLAAHMRSMREPLLKRHPFANRPFLVWALGTALVLGLGLGVPLLRHRLHLMTLPPSLLAVVIGSAVLIPSWWEPVKWIRRLVRSMRRGARRTTAAASS